GRMVQRSDGGRIDRFVYDAAANGIGALSSAESADGVRVAYEYDARGFRSLELWHIDDAEYAIGRQYDGVGRLSRLTYPGSAGGVAGVAATPFHLDYEYAKRGHLRAIRSGDRVWYEAETYDDAGRLSRYKVGPHLRSERRYSAEHGRLAEL